MIRLRMNTLVVFVLPGDPANRLWVRAEVQLNSRSTFTLAIEGIVGGDDKTDIALDDISFSAGCYLVNIKQQLERITIGLCEIAFGS